MKKVKKVLSSFAFIIMVLIMKVKAADGDGMMKEMEKSVEDFLVIGKAQKIDYGTYAPPKSYRYKQISFVILFFVGLIAILFNRKISKKVKIIIIGGLMVISILWYYFIKRIAPLL